jgi:tetraacyldisaccharide 4'-kinase
MKRIKDKKELHIRINAFFHKVWFSNESTVFFPILKILSNIYYFILRNKKQDKKSIEKSFVICVGGINVGGTGKTPCAIEIYNQLNEFGKRVAFVTRGYIPGGESINKVIKISRGEKADVATVGDEALLLSRVGDTYVSRDRFKAAEIASNDGTEIIIMDDGLQNRSLQSDYKICVFDSEYGVGNGYLLPAGPLREKFEDRVNDIDKIIVIRRSEAIQRELEIILSEVPQEKIVNARICIKNPEGFQNRDYVCVAGIGHPEKFFATAESAGVIIVKRYAFPDHYEYSEDDLAEAFSHGCRVLTTAKDFKRIPERFHSMTDVLEIELRFDSNEFISEIANKISIHK